MNASANAAPTRPTVFPPPAGASTSPVSVTVRRTIAAPAQVLFDAWLDPASVAVWLRPNKTTHSIATIDPVVGGRFQIDMHKPEMVVEHRGRYVEIDRPHRLVFTWNSPATNAQDTLVTVSFVERDGRTEVTILHEQLPEYMANGHTSGWTDGLAGLDAFAAPGAG